MARVAVVWFLEVTGLSWVVWSNLFEALAMVGWLQFWLVVDGYAFLKQVSHVPINDILRFEMFVSLVHLLAAAGNYCNHCWILFCCSYWHFNTLFCFHLFLFLILSVCSVNKLWVLSKFRCILLNRSRIVCLGSSNLSSCIVFLSLFGVAFYKMA